MESLKRNQDVENGKGTAKKRKSRWGEDADADKNILNGIPTYIPPGLSKEQEEQYILQLQVEEITRRLRTGELGIPQNIADRSPSPEPLYSSDGKRLNTREFRVRKKLEENRHKLIQAIIKTNIDYKPPMDYRAPSIKLNDRVYIPQDEHPEINFIGLLIGPRGNTLRTLEKETGTTVIIRGKGSVKDGKLAIKDGKPLPGQDEPLHAYITSPDPDAIKTCIAKIKKIIQEGISIPDTDNTLRQQQLKELALLNGTFREGDALAKLKQLQEAETIVTNKIFCTMCGGAGHIAQDCKQRRPGESLNMMLKSNSMQPVRSAAIDTEYMSLMQELGQEVPQNMRGRIGMGSVGGGGQYGNSFQRTLELPAPRYASLMANMYPNNGPSLQNNFNGRGGGYNPPKTSIPSLMDIQVAKIKNVGPPQNNFRGQGPTGGQFPGNFSHGAMGGHHDASGGHGGYGGHFQGQPGATGAPTFNQPGPYPPGPAYNQGPAGGQMGNYYQGANMYNQGQSQGPPGPGGPKVYDNTAGAHPSGGSLQSTSVGTVPPPWAQYQQTTTNYPQSHYPPQNNYPSNYSGGGGIAPPPPPTM